MNEAKNLAPVTEEDNYDNYDTDGGSQRANEVNTNIKELVEFDYEDDFG